MWRCSPGERLPEFPRPTHGRPASSPEQLRALDLRPPRTLHNAIGHLDPDADRADERAGGPRLRFTQPRASPHRWDAPLRATIKAGSGCYDVHPSHLRRFTVRELACLQTFPDRHRFFGLVGQQRRQVGNAVPPLMAEALLRQVRAAMRESDARDAAAAAAAIAPAAAPAGLRAVIELDIDDDEVMEIDVELISDLEEEQEAPLPAPTSRPWWEAPL